MSRTFASARRVAGVYLAVSVLWIASSDYLLGLFVADAATFARLQTFKGWFFVTVSAALIWWLVRREVEKLRRSETRFRTLAEQGIAGFYVIDRGRFVYCNERLGDVFGYSRDEVIGRSPLDLAAPEDRERITDLLREPVDGGRSRIQYEFDGLRRDGTRVRVEVIGRPVVWDERACVAGVLIDVTERSELELQLRQAMRVEAVGHLTGAVVHDFNNLLTGILGQLDLALLDLPEDAAARNELRIARDTTRRAAVLTQKLLAFTRTQVHRPRGIDPNAAIRQMEGLLRSLKPSPVRLHVDLAPDVRPFVLDESDFDQLVVNLYVNAVQAIEGQGDVWIRTEMSDGAVVLELRDTGRGMDQRTVARIFDPFFTTKERGTGLGLATVRRIVEDAAGRVTVHSRPGGGTTFRISLPAADRALVELPGQEGETADLPASPATILVVDDDSAVRRVMRLALTRAGHRVLQARDGESALEIVEENPGIDLIVADVSLPRMSGPEFVEEVVASRRDVQVIFTSGYAPADLESRQEVLDRYPFLVKPFSIDALLRVAADTLRGSDPQAASA